MPRVELEQVPEDLWEELETNEGLVVPVLVDEEDEWWDPMDDWGDEEGKANNISHSSPA